MSLASVSPDNASVTSSRRLLADKISLHIAKYPFSFFQSERTAEMNDQIMKIPDLSPNVQWRYGTNGGLVFTQTARRQRTARDGLNKRH